MAEQTAKIEKISGAAAQIQNVERPRPIKPEVLYAFYVNANPVVGVLVGVDLSRVWPIRVMFAQPYQFRLVNRGENPSRAYRVRPAASVLPQTFRRVAAKKFFKFLRKSHGKGCNEARDTQGTAVALPPKLWRAKPQPLVLHLYPDQTGRAFARHESACPAVARIKELFVTPKHLQVRSGGFLPPNFVVDVPFPRRGVTAHEIEIKRGWPTENTVTDCNKGLITRRRQSCEMVARFLGCRCEGAERENIAAAGQCKLVVLS